MSNEQPSATWLDLFDWRCRVAAMYREREESLLSTRTASKTLQHFRTRKDELFARHPQTPLNQEDLAAFTGLLYFPYNPALRVVATVEPEQAQQVTAARSGESQPLPLERAATLHFTLEEAPQHLTVYWIDVYGGGLFLPFLDATCPTESYGGGRYLFDTVKGSSFTQLDAGASRHGWTGSSLVLDFNYAYNPSCAYDPRWVCPLSPRENRLQVAVRAGERKFHD